MTESNHSATHIPLFLISDMGNLVANLSDVSKLNKSVHLAVSCGNITKFKELFKTNININEEIFGYTAIEITLIRGLDDILKLLLEQKGIKFDGFKTRSAFLSAIYRMSEEVVHLLLKRPLTLNNNSVSDYAIWASHDGRSDLLEIFLKPPYRSKLRRNHISFSEETITIASAVKGHLPALKLLVEHHYL